MDTDKFIEFLKEQNISDSKIDKILEIMNSGDSDIAPLAKEDGKNNLISSLEIKLLEEKDPIKKTVIAAKILSMRLDE